MSYRPNPDGYDINKWWAHEQKQRVRRPGTRWLLLLGLALVVSWPVLQIAVGEPDDRVFPNIGLLLPLIIGASMSPFARENWLTARGRATYDEFERDAFARATTWAYVLFLALVSLAFAYLWAASAAGWPLPRTADDWSACGLTLLIAGAALPLTMAEFLVPLPPLGDDWED